MTTTFFLIPFLFANYNHPEFQQINLKRNHIINTVSTFVISFFIVSLCFYRQSKIVLHNDFHDGRYDSVDMFTERVEFLIKNKDLMQGNVLIVSAAGGGVFLNTNLESLWWNYYLAIDNRQSFYRINSFEVFNDYLLDREVDTLLIVMDENEVMAEEYGIQGLPAIVDLSIGR